MTTIVSFKQICIITYFQCFEILADADLRTNALIKRGRLQTQFNEREKGLADFNEAEKISPNNPDLCNGRGQTYFILRQYTEASKYFEMAMSLMPSHSYACVKKLTSKYSLIDGPESYSLLLTLIDDIKGALETFPDCVDLYILITGVFMDLCFFQEAHLYSEKAITLFPKTPEPYVFRGLFVLQWKGDVRAAINFLNKAIEIDDKCVIAYQQLGLIENEHKSIDRGIQWLDKAISVATAPDDISHLFKLRSLAVAKRNVTKKFLTTKYPFADDLTTQCS